MISRATIRCIVLAACTTAAIAAPAQTYERLTSFINTVGWSPSGSVVQSGKNFYGTTTKGGFGGGCTDLFQGCGTIYEITPTRKYTTVYTFCEQSGCSDGATPAAGLLAASDGTLYGTTQGGGAGAYCTDTAGCGIVYRLNAEQKVVPVYAFCAQPNCADGAYPFGSLAQGANGNFYGTTVGGGAHQFGTAFEITPSGKITVLYSFCVLTNCADGAYPASGLVQGANGHLYGITQNGGGTGYGTVFDIAPGGDLRTLYSFCSKRNCADGLQPEGNLVEGADGNFYGTTSGGGANGQGTVFAVAPSGRLKTLHSFDGSDGANPFAGLLQVGDGNFYGTASTGGAYGSIYGGGTIFKITAAGKLTTLYNFCIQSNCSDGAEPAAALILANNGNLIATTVSGGGFGNGAVFRLAVNLGQ